MSVRAQIYPVRESEVKVRSVYLIYQTNDCVFCVHERESTPFYATFHAQTCVAQ